LEEQKSEKKIRAEVRIPLVLIHTPFGLKFFDRIAKTRAAKVYADFNTYLMPFITALAVFLIVGSLMVLFANSAAREGVRGVGPQANLLIPGLNPYLPITYGWIGLIITIIIHEAGHGIVARVYNIRVDSTGIVLLGIIPIGAFVNIERDELNKASIKRKSAVLTAGPLNNMILAAVSLAALYLLVSTLTALPTDPHSPQFGIIVTNVNSGSLAQSIGMEPQSIIQYVNGQQIKSNDDLSNALRSNLGKTIDITWKDKSNKIVTHQVALPHTAETGKPILGVEIAVLSSDPHLVLDRYKNAFGQNPLALLLPPTMQQSAVPYSDLMAPKYTSSIFGSTFAPIANFLFWLWFINFNVGIFNALPIGPLDGGQLYSTLIENKAKSQTLARNANTLVTLAMVAIVIVSLVLPYVIL
jgi:membrane-associated protease RseP (regulator of RpoE activity)